MTKEEQAHQEAIKQNKNWYKDPTTGLIVFTAKFLDERGYCCYSNCRHCPYGYFPEG